jgi:hypothetical protein
MQIKITKHHSVIVMLNSKKPNKIAKKAQHYMILSYFVLAKLNLMPLKAYVNDLKNEFMSFTIN